jgi:hypothetical protein
MSTQQTPTSTFARPGKMASSQSLNHLLNFSLPPRQAQPVPRRSRKYGTQQGVWNKERECSGRLDQLDGPGLPRRAGFINAQYRFVMNPSGDYTVHFADPDMYAAPITSSVHHC